MEVRRFKRSVVLPIAALLVTMTACGPANITYLPLPEDFGGEGWEDDTLRQLVVITEPAEDSYVVFFNGTDLPDLIFDPETTRELYITPPVDHLPWPTTEGRFELALLCCCVLERCIEKRSSAYNLKADSRGPWIRDSLRDFRDRTCDPPCECPYFPTTWSPIRC
jgi:hypothetical protein